MLMRVDWLITELPAPKRQEYLAEGSHRRLYTWSDGDYQEMSDIWSNREVALPDDSPDELEIVEGMPEGGNP